MKKTTLSVLVTVAFAVNPLLASAAANDKYPAASFEPTVIYLDKETVAEQTASEFDPKYPAANFESKVVYIDKELAEQAGAPFDAKYPAAYFKPNVIFP